MCLTGDSHQPAMRHAVEKALQGRPLDLLFIDGDHRYEGVVSDFALYRTLVRPGGLIAFHDIVPDHRARFGVETEADAGGVPQFWAVVRARYGAAVREIVEDPNQDACGIGLIEWSGAEPAR